MKIVHKDIINTGILKIDPTEKLEQRGMWNLLADTSFLQEGKSKIDDITNTRIHTWTTLSRQSTSMWWHRMHGKNQWTDQARCPQGAPFRQQQSHGWIVTVSGHTTCYDACISTKQRTRNNKHDRQCSINSSTCIAMLSKSYNEHLTRSNVIQPRHDDKHTINIQSTSDWEPEATARRQKTFGEWTQKESNTIIQLATASNL